MIDLNLSTASFIEEYGINPPTVQKEPGTAPAQEKNTQWS